MYHSFLIHSFADGHLGCFQYLAIVNCAAMNIGVHRFFWVGVSGSLSTKEKRKQNTTRDIEVKNNLTIARGELGGDSGDRGFQELL